MANSFSQALKGRIKTPRRSALSIPAPNPDPQAPNSDRMIKSSNLSDVTLSNNSTLDNRATVKPDNKPGQGKSKPYFKPGDDAGRGLPPTTSPGNDSLVPRPGQPDPRDDQYWREIAALMQKRNEGLRQLDLEDTYSKSAFDQSMEELGRQQPRDELNLQQSHNRSGSFYSSAMGEDVGKLQQEYFSSRTQLTDSFQRESSLRSLMRDAINNGYTLDEAAALAEATERAARKEYERPTGPVDDMLDDSKGKLKGKPGRGKPRHGKPNNSNKSPGGGNKFNKPGRNKPGHSKLGSKNRKPNKPKKK